MNILFEHNLPLLKNWMLPFPNYCFAIVVCFLQTCLAGTPCDFGLGLILVLLEWPNKSLMISKCSLYRLSSCFFRLSTLQALVIINPHCYHLTWGCWVSLMGIGQSQVCSLDWDCWLLSHLCDYMLTMMGMMPFLISANSISLRLFIGNYSPIYDQWYGCFDACSNAEF